MGSKMNFFFSIPASCLSTKSRWAAWRHLAMLASISLVVFVVTGFPSTGYTREHGNRNLSAPYYEEARRNLTTWRSSIFKMTAEFYKATEKLAGSQSEPQGHQRFRLLAPFVTCPSDESPERIGGEGDGAN